MAFRGGRRPLCDNPDPRPQAFARPSLEYSRPSAVFPDSGLTGRIPGFSLRAVCRWRRSQRTQPLSQRLSGTTGRQFTRRSRQCWRETAAPCSNWMARVDDMLGGVGLAEWHGGRKASPVSQRVSQSRGVRLEKLTSGIRKRVLEKTPKPSSVFTLS